MHSPNIPQKKAQVIKHLNKVLQRLIAINQYFRMPACSRTGARQASVRTKCTRSIDEMEARRQADRAPLFLDGLPNLRDLGKLMIGEDVKECPGLRSQVEMAAIRTCAGIAIARQVQDYVSRSAARDPSESEEEHIDRNRETQLQLIDRVGIQN